MKRKIYRGIAVLAAIALIPVLVFSGCGDRQKTGTVTPDDAQPSVSDGATEIPAEGIEILP